MRELGGKREEVDSCTGQGSSVSPLGPGHCYGDGDGDSDDRVEDDALLVTVMMMIMFVLVGHSLLCNSTKL